LAGSDDARVLLEKAAALRFLGRFDEVRDILNRILTEHPGNDLVRAMALAEKCWADYNGRDVSDSLKTALDDCKQAADIFNDNEDALGQARTLTRHALIISDKDSSAPDFASAREMQKRAIEITHERGAIRDEAGGRQNLANILMEQTPPDPELARTEYERSQEMFRNLGDLAGVAGVENDQAVRLIDLCRFQDALNSARQARQNWNAVGSRYEAIALANQGSMESFLGDLTQAELDLKSALLMAEASKLSIDRDNWLITLGETYAAEGNLPRAEQCYKEGPCYDDRQPSAVRNLNVLADAAVSYAALLIDQKDFAGAERVAQNALAHATNEKDPDEESWARVVLANALLAQQKGAPLNRAKDAMMGLAAIKSKDCRVGVAAGLSLARIEGRSGNIDRQQEKLTEVLQKAHAMGLLGYELEATLDQAEADLRAGKSNSARDLAQQVVNQSGSRKFPLVKARASDLFNRAKVGGIAGN
jgi:tetratricopeptide (TPR) repeat protein